VPTTPPPTETRAPAETITPDDTPLPADTTSPTEFAPPTPATMRLTEADDGSSASLNVSDLLEIALDGNPTTGYQWEVGSGNGDVLQQRGEPMFVAESDAVGSGGTVTLTFDAVAAGRVALWLIYHPQYDPAAPPIRTFAVTVTVH
jgi:predicted secreted protein